MPELFPTHFVGDALSGGLGFAEVRQRQRIGFELAERFERRVFKLRALHDRPLVVAVGK